MRAVRNTALSLRFPFVVAATGRSGCPNRRFPDPGGEGRESPTVVGGRVTEAAVPVPWTTRARAILPEGGSLPDDAWLTRHRAIMVVLWLHAALIPVFALTR